MKKFLLGVLTFLMAFGLCFAVACEGDNGDSLQSSPTESSPQSSSPAPAKTGTLANRLLDAEGETELKITGTVDVNTSSLKESRMGTASSTKIIVDGGEDGAIIKATGAGSFAIRPYAGEIVFKNITFKDYSAANGEPNGWFGTVTYLEMSKKLRFENCNFECSIWLCDGADAEFENCTFESLSSGLYSVWAADGNISLKNCEFIGYRGLKIHEQVSDVKSVLIDGCTFDRLQTKVGIAIGTINVDPMQTQITVKNSTFTRCQDWDNEGSLEGINGFYEADTYTSDFAFLSQNNLIDDVPSDNIDPEYKPVN